MEERLWRSPSSSYIRALPEKIGVTARSCSSALERVLSDFGLERSFAQAARLTKEHYGFEISTSTLSMVTGKHADLIAQQQQERPGVGALPADGAEQLIAQSDGSFVRIVTTDPEQADSRSSRTIDFQEARLCAATAQGSATTYYECTFGSVDSVGSLWAQAAKNAGWGLNSNIHIVGDGASWIAKQAEQVFGTQGSFLVDFYHVCEYLAAAAPSCSQEPSDWMKTCKQKLQCGQTEEVIQALKDFLEPESVPDENAPVRKAYRYLTNRADQLDYQSALEQKLPIGSGLIESAHKQVIQSRMKLPGAAWSIETAEAIIRARAFRASGYWDEYWNEQRKQKKAA